MKRVSVKAAFVVLLTLLLLAAAQVGLAADPVHGKVRVFGYGDKVTYPKTKFTPYAVALYKEHMEDRYLEYWYARATFKDKELHKDEFVRHWMFQIVDESGEPEPFGGDFELHLPYPSIWSADRGDYWKWTKAYATKHYDWNAKYADHAKLGPRYPDSNLKGYYYEYLLFLRDYGRVSFDDFGVVLRFRNNHDTLVHDVFLIFTKKD